jgi:hypothetical protein
VKKEIRVSKPQILTVEAKEYTVYVAEDGKEFFNSYEAEQYKNQLKWKRITDYFNSKYKIVEVKEDIDIEGQIKAVYIDENYTVEEIQKDFKEMFPYYRDYPKRLEKLRKGWQFIIEQEWDSSSYGKWSNYDINIYYPEEFIEEKEEQIKVLKKFI